MVGSVAKFLVSSTTFDMPLFSGSWGEARGVIEFKGVHYPKSVILGPDGISDDLAGEAEALQARQG
ncbi:hypothetical protein H0485_21435 [Pseudogemmobacter sp. CC-YST710]|uniref:Uncharacterized protein n=1 Tax=Pseudogemmobacter faecipullorum TaxID=2755041 RepID=A0ABS8CT14_9RHOB|nr:hypothetical protein [Pseudogemmobacter faecipullorum]MCB5412499.1 hypothetical protein [Pseudogemmobacter faecipullorum]